MFATTYLFVEVGLLVIHEMERYVVVCFSQAFSSLLFVLLALFRLNKGVVHQMNLKRLQDLDAVTTKIDGVLPAFGVSIFQILFLWVGTVPSA